MNSLKRYTIIGIFFVIIVGTLSHFIYEWSGEQFLLGFFFPVSESTWEHMKMCFFPMVFYSFYMKHKLQQEYSGITVSLLAGTLVGTGLVPVIFYTYSGILGFHLVFLDIGVFLLSVLGGFRVVYQYALCQRNSTAKFLLETAVAFLAVCFLLFTYYPPNVGIFIQPPG